MFQKVKFQLCVLKIVVDVVELNLAKFHILSPFFKEPFHRAYLGVNGTTEVFYFAEFLLFDKILYHSVALVEITFDVGFADVVYEIKIKMVDATLF